MKKLVGKHIIIEIIPNHSNPNMGNIVQISALKLDGYKLINRFDYRVNEDLITNEDLLDMISYDKDKFIYVDSYKKLVDEFNEWYDNIPLLIIDNAYTLDYLKDYSNKESVFDYLNMKYSNDILEKIVDKYHLELSNYIVDLLYESLLLSNKD